MYHIKLIEMKFFFIFFIFLQLPITAIANNDFKLDNISENTVLKGIYGDSGHVGFELALGMESFDYYYSRDEHFFNYISKVSVYKMKFDLAITYFSTDFNRYTFLISLNSDLALNIFNYKSFSFGIIDNIYIKDYLSGDIGVITRFEGSYKFFVILGASYYFFSGKSYHLILSDSFNVLLNSVNISNTISLKWMYIF